MDEVDVTGSAPHCTQVRSSVAMFVTEPLRCRRIAQASQADSTALTEYCQTSACTPSCVCSRRRRGGSSGGVSDSAGRHPKSRRALAVDKSPSGSTVQRLRYYGTAPGVSPVHPQHLWAPPAFSPGHAVHQGPFSLSRRVPRTEECGVRSEGRRKKGQDGEEAEQPSSSLVCFSSPSSITGRTGGRTPTSSFGIDVLDGEESRRSASRLHRQSCRHSSVYEQAESDDGAAASFPHLKTYLTANSTVFRRGISGVTRRGDGHSTENKLARTVSLSLPRQNNAGDDGGELEWPDSQPAFYGSSGRVATGRSFSFDSADDGDRELQKMLRRQAVAVSAFRSNCGVEFKNCLHQAMKQTGLRGTSKTWFTSCGHGDDQRSSRRTAKSLEEVANLLHKGVLDNERWTAAVWHDETEEREEQPLFLTEPRYQILLCVVSTLALLGFAVACGVIVGVVMSCSMLNPSNVLLSTSFFIPEGLIASRRVPMPRSGSSQASHGGFGLAPTSRNRFQASQVHSARGDSQVQTEHRLMTTANDGVDEVKEDMDGKEIASPLHERSPGTNADHMEQLDSSARTRSKPHRAAPGDRPSSTGGESGLALYRPEVEVGRSGASTKEKKSRQEKRRGNKEPGEKLYAVSAVPKRAEDLLQLVADFDESLSGVEELVLLTPVGPGRGSSSFGGVSDRAPPSAGPVAAVLTGGFSVTLEVHNSGIRSSLSALLELRYLPATRIGVSAAEACFLSGDVRLSPSLSLLSAKSAAAVPRDDVQHTSEAPGFSPSARTESTSPSVSVSSAAFPSGCETEVDTEAGQLCRGLRLCKQVWQSLSSCSFIVSVSVRHRRTAALTENRRSPLQQVLFWESLLATANSVTAAKERAPAPSISGVSSVSGPDDHTPLPSSWSSPASTRKPSLHSTSPPVSGIASASTESSTGRPSSGFHNASSPPSPSSSYLLVTTPSFEAIRLNGGFNQVTLAINLNRRILAAEDPYLLASLLQDCGTFGRIYVTLSFRRGVANSALETMGEGSWATIPFRLPCTHRQSSYPASSMQNEEQEVTSSRSARSQETTRGKASDKRMNKLGNPDVFHHFSEASPSEVRISTKFSSSPKNGLSSTEAEPVTVRRAPENDIEAIEKGTWSGIREQKGNSSEDPRQTTASESARKHRQTAPRARRATVESTKEWPPKAFVYQALAGSGGITGVTNFLIETFLRWLMWNPLCRPIAEGLDQTSSEEKKT